MPCHRNEYNDLETLKVPKMVSIYMIDYSKIREITYDWGNIISNIEIDNDFSPVYIILDYFIGIENKATDIRWFNNPVTNSGGNYIREQIKFKTNECTIFDKYPVFFIEYDNDVCEIVGLSGRGCARVSSDSKYTIYESISVKGISYYKKIIN